MRCRVRADVRACLAAGLALTLATGCSGAGPSRDQLAPAFATTFANLYALQQAERGTLVEPTSLGARARCGRAGGVDSGSGPGEDWRCQVTYESGRQRVPALVTYSLTVRADGCFTADGDEPAELVTQQSVVRPDGVTVPNPLWQLDGCIGGR